MAKLRLSITLAFDVDYYPAESLTLDGRDATPEELAEYNATEASDAWQAAKTAVVTAVADALDVNAADIVALGHADDPTDAATRQRAKDLHAQEGDVEIDDNAVVSRGNDDGAYVQAWVWVPDESEGG